MKEDNGIPTEICVTEMYLRMLKYTWTSFRIYIHEGQNTNNRKCFHYGFVQGVVFFLNLTNLYASCGQEKPYFKIRCISMKSHSIISADELFLQSIYLLFGFFEGVFYYKRKRSFLFLFKNISITKTQKNPDVCKFTTICSMCSHTRIIK